MDVLNANRVLHRAIPQAFLFLWLETGDHHILVWSNRVKKGGKKAFNAPAFLAPILGGDAFAVQCAMCPRVLSRKSAAVSL
jgi:hypothetical protein